MVEAKVVGVSKNTVTLLSVTGEKVEVTKDILKQAIDLKRVAIVESFGKRIEEKARALGYCEDDKGKYLYKTNGDTVYIVILPRTKDLSQELEKFREYKKMYVEGGESLEDTYCLFYFLYTEYIDLRGMITHNVRKMGNTFHHCSRLKSINFGNIDTSNVTSMQEMFAGCNGITELDLSSFDTRNVKYMTRMFEDCYSLKYVNLSSFNTSNVTTMSGMFCNCGALTSVDLSSFDTSNVRSMSGMFRYTAINSLDLSTFDTYKVQDIRYMFDGCGNLTQLNFSKFDNTNVVNERNMFFGCTNLKSVGIKNFGPVKYLDIRDGFGERKIRKGVLIE